jgi:hypothetical protein
MSKPCVWCAGSDDDSPATDALCRSHLAEFYGLSQDQLDRADTEQDAEYAEWVLSR